MKVEEVGKYRFIQDFHTRNSISRATIRTGTVVNITQVNKEYKQVIGPLLLDWTYWELPVEHC